MKLEKRKRIRSESFKKKKKRDRVVARFDLRVETGETGGRGIGKHRGGARYIKYPFKIEIERKTR